MYFVFQFANDIVGLVVQVQNVMMFVQFRMVEPSSYPETLTALDEMRGPRCSLRIG